MVAEMADRTMFADIRAVVRRIPRGKVSTYGAVALAAGYLGGARQVAWALRAAKSPVPWHRVIGQGGRIKLRGPAGVEQIQHLMAEGVEVHGNRVNLKIYEHLFRRRAGQRRG